MKKQIIIIAIFLLGITLFHDVKAQSLTTSQVENAIKKDGKYALSQSMHFRIGNAGEIQNENAGIVRILMGEVVKVAEKED